MPTIAISYNSPNEGKVYNLTESEAEFLKKITKQLNDYFLPGKLNLTEEELVLLYFNNKIEFTNILNKTLSKPENQYQIDKIRSFLKEVNYKDLNVVISKGFDDSYRLANQNHDIQNLFLMYILCFYELKAVILNNKLEDHPIMNQSLSNIIYDVSMLKTLKQKGYPTTVYSFLNMLCFRWDDKDLLAKPGIGKRTVEKLKNYLQEAGFPIIYSTSHKLKKLLGNIDGFYKILLSSKEDLEEAGFDKRFIEQFEGTKYLQPSKLIKEAEKEENITTPANNKQKPQPTQPTTIKTSKPSPKIETVKASTSHLSGKFIDKAVREYFKSHLDELLKLARKNNELILTYVDCIAFNKLKNEQIMEIIKIQPKVIRHLPKNSTILSWKKYEAEILKAIDSKLTKQEAISLKSYIKTIRNANTSVSF